MAASWKLLKFSCGNSRGCVPKNIVKCNKMAHRGGKVKRECLAFSYNPSASGGLVESDAWKKPNFTKVPWSQGNGISGLYFSCASVYRQLYSKGSGTNVKHARPFMDEEENLLWDCGILGWCLLSLKNALFFYYIGKRFSVKHTQFPVKYTRFLVKYTQ